MRNLNLLPTLCLAALPFGLVACGGGGSPQAGAGQVDNLEILDLGLPAEATLVGAFDPLADEYRLRLPFLGDTLALRPIYANPGAVSTGTIGLQDAGFGELEALVAEGDNEFEFSASLAATGEQRSVRVVVQRAFAAQVRHANTLKSDVARTGDGIGAAVATEGGLLVVGAPKEDLQQGSTTLADAGAVYLFERSGDSWTQVARLQAPAPGADDFFGTSVAVAGEVLVVGAPGEDGAGAAVDPLVDEGALDCGAAYIFRRIDGTWTPTHYLKPDAPGLRNTRAFGTAVKIVGQTIAVGAPQEGTRLATGGFLVPAARAGAVYTFVEEGAELRFAQRLQAPDAAVAADYGMALAGSGARLAIGAPGADAQRGKVYLMARTSSLAGFELQSEIVAPNASIQDAFGRSLDLSADRLVIGAPGEDSGAEGVGGDQLDESAQNSGAAYVYEVKGQFLLFEAYIKGLSNTAGARFGASVALANDIVCVGAPLDIGAAFGEETNGIVPIAPIGSVFTYTRREGAFTAAGAMRAANPHAGAQFGASVAIGADDIVVGSPEERSFGAGIDGSSVVVGGPGRGAVLAFR
ncbi:MAG: hypothetical protein RIR65_1157 [Planctomycetota bacterium]